jgi:hypothetical protein
VRKETGYTFARMTELQAKYSTALIIGTDGGAFPDGSAAGYGVTIGRLTAQFQKLSANCYVEQQFMNCTDQLNWTRTPKYF